MQCVFLLWCMYPSQYNGSKFLYKRVIRPWVLKNEEKIDNVLNYVSNNVEKIADQGEHSASTKLYQPLLVRLT